VAKYNVSHREAAYGGAHIKQQRADANNKHQHETVVWRVATNRRLRRGGNKHIVAAWHRIGAVTMAARARYQARGALFSVKKLIKTRICGARKKKNSSVAIKQWRRVAAAISGIERRQYRKNEEHRGENGENHQRRTILKAAKAAMA